MGLLGDLGDQVEDPVDLLGARPEGVGAAGDRTDPLLHLLDTVQRLLHGDGAGVAALFRAECEFGLRRGVSGDLRGGPGQFLHRGGDLHHAGGLLGRTGG